MDERKSFIEEPPLFTSSSTSSVSFLPRKPPGSRGIAGREESAGMRGIENEKSPLKGLNVRSTIWSSRGIALCSWPNNLGRLRGMMNGWDEGGTDSILRKKSLYSFNSCSFGR